MTASELASYGTSLPNLSMPIAENGDKRTPIEGNNNSSDTQASVKFGLPSLMSEPLDEAGIPVPRQDLNGLYNMLSKVVHYLMAGGRIPWMQAEATAIGGYPNGAEVTYNGHNYKSLADSNTALPTDTTKWACIDYLPLAGGTMTGGIKLAANNFNDAAVPEIFIGAGTVSNKDGACLILRSKNAPYDENKNGFEIICPHINGDGGVVSLLGRQNGLLSWRNGKVYKNIVRSVNGINAGADGNVVLPLETRTTLFYNASGQNTGDISLNRSWRDFKYLIVTGGDDDKSVLNNKIQDTDAMAFAVDNGKRFTLYDSGTLYWEIDSVSNGTTNTLLKKYDENCVIFMIVGVN